MKTLCNFIGFIAMGACICVLLVLAVPVSLREVAGRKP